ncbi:hypothetical protein L596_016166 [Steinernema carpocapsae]|uniref:Uncharacterized protein n=1 Tax=Steinernema carpocapsae TaxID=34508 RepID=A0A4U5NI61_STECR|nr:hypothetical protein L596_016166 [Steinernema carpocapsae]
MTTSDAPKKLTSSCEADRFHRVEISFVEAENDAGEDSTAASSRGVNQIQVRLVQKLKDATVGETTFLWPEDTLPQQITYDSTLGMLEMKSEKNLATLPLRIPKAAIHIGLTKTAKAPKTIKWSGFEEDRTKVKSTPAIAKAARQIIMKGFTGASLAELKTACAQTNGITKSVKFSNEDLKVLIECLGKVKNPDLKIVMEGLVKANVFGSQLTPELYEAFMSSNASSALYKYLTMPQVIVYDNVFVQILKSCLDCKDHNKSFSLFAALMKKNITVTGLTAEVRDKFSVEEVTTILEMCSTLILKHDSKESTEDVFTNVLDLADILMNTYSQQLMWHPKAKQALTKLRAQITTAITLVEQFSKWSIDCHLTTEFPELDGEPPCDYVIRKVKLSKRRIC